MSYLSITHISKTYGPKQVLNQVSLIVHAGERIGLVGANGVGKSTLLKIITGEIEADDGSVMLTPGLQLGYLAQAITHEAHHTLDDLIADSLRHLHELEARMRDLEAQMRGDDLTAILAEYSDVSEQFERYGGYEMAYRVQIVLEGLNVGHLPRERLFTTLSGGEKARVGLALLLLRAPDILLLDEPTNHLDHNSLAWLEAYLQGYRGGILIVSHDRQFLNQTATAIIEIDEHSRQAKRYTGNYDSYQQAKTLERYKWELAFSQQQEEIKALRLEIKETAHNNNNYRPPSDGDKILTNKKKATHANTVAKKVRAAEEKLKRIDANRIPEPPDGLRFEPDFDPAVLDGRIPMRVSDVSKTYDGRVVLRDVRFTLDSHSRILLVGANGAGKSTLLRLLAGVENPDSGEIYRNPAVRVGYLDQEGRGLDPEKTVFTAYQEGLFGHEQQLMSILLRSGLFRHDELERKVGQLSLGQRRKLQLARLIAGRANLLILDEPTNYISFDILEALEEALCDFPGPVIAASHDRRFIDQFNGEIWEVREGEIAPVGVMSF
ncbi:MAG: ABC-F type ribosomal protection protein [Chitinophagaceae bacterium]|nr:ABC-F type ribosomal protection protein [Anaerolineae bacterium]